MTSSVLSSYLIPIDSTLVFAVGGVSAGLSGGVYMGE